VGGVIAGTFVEYFKDTAHVDVFDRLLKEVELTKETSEEDQKFAGVNFVITGSVEHFVNRAQVKEEIEKRGGKVTGSVTSKTNYLINNDTGSGTAKNKKARELGIPIISEEDFLQMMNE
jgi:DNA ligase (NAD+)